MNRRIYFILAFYLLISGLFTSCESEFMDVDPLDRISANQVWRDEALSQAFVNGVYQGLGDGGFGDGYWLASGSDESLFNFEPSPLNQGSVSPSNLGRLPLNSDWATLYNTIRSCNLGITNLNGPESFDNPTAKNRMLGELHFLRAFYYHQAVRYYGAVPIIDRVYELDEDYSIERNTYEECINFIVADCDQAANLLSGHTTDKSRASSLAALALKSRVLLYAASDLHDVATAKSNSTILDGYEFPEYFGYTEGDRTARWEAAQAAAKEALDAASGYKLGLTAPVSIEEGIANYTALYAGGASAAADVQAAQDLIFTREYVADQETNGRLQGVFNAPNGYHGWGANQPISALVDDYEYMDLSDPANPTAEEFDWNNPVHKADPYKNRDPRFYATVLYDGATYKPRPSDVPDPANQIQTGEYDIIQDGTTTIWNGLDTRTSTVDNWNGTRTGYFVRKFLDPDPNVSDQVNRQVIPWPFIRYTEVVLNYIEASIELNQLAEATSYLNQIRYRSGMPAVAAVSQDELREAYRHERRIEMAFEEQRYFDARRWMIAPEVFGKKLTIINVVGKFKSGQSMEAPYRHDESIYDYTYTPIESNSYEDRQWLDKLYFRPFSRDEVNKNSELEQNPGYE